MEASSREVLEAVTTVVEEVAEEFGANTAVALSRAKAYVAVNAEESDEVDARELGREVFADQPRVAERFDRAVEEGALPERVVVEKVNVVKKALRPTQQNPQGGISTMEAPIHVSNVMVICPECKQPTRTGKKRDENGKKVRVCKKCGKDID